MPEPAEDAVRALVKGAAEVDECRLRGAARPLHPNRFRSGSVPSPKRCVGTPMQSSIETYRLHSGVFFGDAMCWPVRMRPPPFPPSRIGRLFGSCLLPSDKLDPHMIIELSSRVRSPS